MSEKPNIGVRTRIVSKEINDCSPEDSYDYTPSWLGLMVLMWMAMKMSWTIAYSLDVRDNKPL